MQSQWNGNLDGKGENGDMKSRKRKGKLLVAAVGCLAAFAACGGTETELTEPPTGITGEAVLTVPPAEPPSVVLSEELQHAVSYGTVPEELLEKPAEPVSEKELAELLGAAIALCDGTGSKEWEALTRGAAANNRVTMDYAAMFFLRAAELLGTQQCKTEWNLYAAMRAREELFPSEQMSWCYPLFANQVEEERSYPAMELIDWSRYHLYDMAMLYVSGTHSLYNDRALFDFGRTLSCETVMTKEQAVLAVSRFLDCNFNLYEPIGSEALLECTIPEEAYRAAELLPEVTGATLPDWHGTSLAKDILIYTCGRELFSEEDAILAEQGGFNYVRLVLGYRDFALEREDGWYVNRAQLENLDNIIGWYMQHGIHVCLDLHELPGYFSGAGEEQLDLLTNEEHYHQSVELWRLLAARYAKVPANGLSYNLLNEPNLWYFTQESYAAFASDLIAAIRSADTEKRIVSDGLLTEVWMKGSVSVPCTGLPAEIIQTIHLYPSYASGSWLTVQQGLKEHQDVVSGMVHTDAPLTLHGSFPKGTRIRLHYSEITFGRLASRLSWSSDGGDSGQWDWIGIQPGAGGCADVWFEEEWENYHASFAADSCYEIVLTEPAEAVCLTVESEDGAFIKFDDLEFRIPTEEEHTYLTKEADYGSGYAYRTDRNEVLFFLLAEEWVEGAVHVTLAPDGTLSCDNSPEGADAFDTETLRSYLFLWADWAKETGGQVICNEFAVLVSLPTEVRTAYLEQVLGLFQEFGIPWSLYTSNAEEYGPYHSAAVCFPEQFPQDGSVVLTGEYYVDRALLEVLHRYQKTE